MGIEHRKHERYLVHLVARYATAAEFVDEYVENLSLGGIFIVGAHHLARDQETEVEIDLPGQGRWRVRAKAVFILDPDTAKQANRKPGAGLEITGKQPGFDDAMLGYLLRLGRRRDFVMMVGDVPGRGQIEGAGYQVTPLVAEEALGAALGAVVAVVVPAALAAMYRDRAGRTGAADRVFAVAHVDDIADIIARIDSLLE